MARKTNPQKPQTPAAETTPEKEYSCSFCGKSSQKSRRLIAGPNGIFICEECVEVCGRILCDETNPAMWLPVLTRRKYLGEYLGIKDFAFSLGNNKNPPLKILYLAPNTKPFTAMLKEHIAPLASKYALPLSPLPPVYRNGNRPVLQKSLTEIFNSTMVIADLTGKDPNVAFLSGMVYLFSVPMLILTQDLQDIPPDISHLRHFVYSPDEDGYREMTSQLTPVFDFIANNKFMFNPQKTAAKETANAKL